MRTHSVVAIGIALPIALGGALLLAPAWHGPIILSLSASHGVDAGDLVTVPLFVLAIAAARRRSAAPGSARSLALPASAVTLGVLLLFAGLLTSDGGPLKPAAGATLNGSIKQTISPHSVQVDRWSYVALTYDGTVERLYVDGDLVSSQAAAGRIQTPGNPLWIGGNRPYGEHFDGLIDELRVYERALPDREIRQDMSTPVRPAPGLVAAYSFDARAGRRATDSSGNGNTGQVWGATWAHGRFGNALRFDGRAAVVRVPPSSSLDLARSMTLSGWIRPARRQTGWRTIVQRQVDAYFLTASSGHVTSHGRMDALRVAVIAAAAAWFGALIATARGPLIRARRRSWWLPAALFVIGSLADAAFAPSGALCGCVLVAVWLGETAGTRAERATFRLAAVICAGVTIASLVNVARVGDVLANDDGGIARTAAYGAFFVLAGLAALVGRPTSAPPLDA